THDLSKGVLAGVVLSAVIFAWKMAKIRASSDFTVKQEKVYTISGQLFFGTMSHFVDLFDLHHDPDKIIIDFTHSHVWDQSAAAGIAQVVAKYEQYGKKVEVIGLNKESQLVIDKVGLSAPSGH